MLLTKKIAVNNRNFDVDDRKIIVVDKMPKILQGFYLQKTPHRAIAVNNTNYVVDDRKVIVVDKMPKMLKGFDFKIKPNFWLLTPTVATGTVLFCI